MRLQGSPLAPPLLFNVQLRSLSLCHRVHALKTLNWDADSKPGTFVFLRDRAFYPDFAVVVLHDCMDDSQSQTGSLLPGGKERIEHFIQIFLRDAGAVIFHPNKKS